MREQEQGTYVDCMYCKYIKPELEGSKDCPKCGGSGPVFKPMRMMDSFTSNSEILGEILELPSERELNDSKILLDKLYKLLLEIDLYNFDLKDAIIQKIKELEFIT